MQTFLSYFKELYGFATGKLILNVFLMVVLGLIEGIGIFLLIPLFGLAGVLPAHSIDNAGVTAMTHSFRQMGISLSLPVVLVIYTGMIGGQSWLQRRQNLLNMEIQQRFHTVLSVRLFRAVAKARWPLLLRRVTSDVTHVLTAELMRVATGTYFFLQLIATVFIGAIQMGLAFWIAPGLTLLVVGGGLIFFVLLYPFVKKSRRMGYAISEYNRTLLFQVTEYLNGMKEIKSYGLEDRQIQKFTALRQTVEQNFIASNTLQSQTDMLYKIGAAVFISVFFFFAIEVFALKPQEFLLIIIIFSRLWPRLSSFQSGLQFVAMMLPAFTAARQLETACLADAEGLTDAAGAGRMKLIVGVEFRHISFCYDPSRLANALTDISVSLPAGTTTAIVGVSGSGKSTLVDVLLGLLSPATGEIYLDGIPLRQQLSPWRNSIGYVPQDAVLFHASIRDNLLWFCPAATEAELWQSLRLAAIDSFVRALPEGMDTVIGDRGVRLSGGERQRVVLARALLRNPAVLILDEATSSLDRENEERIQTAIENLQGKLTIVIIAHRFSTIRQADRIYVLEQGRIVEQGNYQSLTLQPNSRFAQLAYEHKT